LGESKVIQGLDPKEAHSILIIGIAGGLAHICARLLLKKYPHLHIIGVDNRSTKHLPKISNLQVQTMKYTRGQFEKLFRENKFDVVYHLGRLSHSSTSLRVSLAERLDLNIMGTGRILELSKKFQVKKVILLSTFHVYGALNDNPVYMKEDSPLRASIKYPELRDVTEMDQLATAWMWKNKDEISTVIFRPCNIIGPQIKNTIGQYLRSKYAPIGIDFNPMFQFIHEFDMSNILVHALEFLPTGIYNTAPDETITLHDAKKRVSGRSVMVPIIGLEMTAKFIKHVWSFPDYLIDYIKYASIIDNSELKKYLPKDIFKFSTKETLDLLGLEK